MVRAILEDRKTVTRRAVKGAGLKWLSDFPPEYVEDSANALCPHGKPGDRLWVRETWGRTYNVNGQDDWPGRPHIAREGDEMVTIYRAYGPWSWCDDDGVGSDRSYWKPSIHMFRRDSRILLEITDVRVERLQDISDEQAIAEGCFFTDYGRKCGHSGTGWTDVGTCPAPESTHQQLDGWMWDKTTSHEQCLGAPRWAFANLWNSTGSNWDSNPWVWAVSFKQVTP
jgi:hypothetical protein